MLFMSYLQLSVLSNIIQRMYSALQMAFELHIIIKIVFKLAFINDTQYHLLGQFTSMSNSK